MVKIKNTSKNQEHLECCVVPSPEDKGLQDIVSEFLRRHKRSTEDKIAVYQHRMELIRTIANCLNPLFSLIVLLKLFHII